MGCRAPLAPTSGCSKSFIASGRRFSQLSSDGNVATPGGHELAGITFGLTAERNHGY